MSGVAPTTVRAPGPLTVQDDTAHRRAANPAVPVSAVGLAVTGGIELALVIFASAIFAAYVSYRTLVSGAGTDHLTIAMAAAVIGMVGNLVGRSLILEVEGTLPGTINLAAAQGRGPEVERAVFTAVNEVRRVIWIPSTVETAPDSR
jgi:hypothetical protein